MNKFNFEGKLNNKNNEDVFEIKDLENKLETKFSASKNFKETINLIYRAKLKPEFLNDKVESEILKERQKFLLSKLENILKGVKDYLNSLNNLNDLYKNEDRDLYDRDDNNLSKEIEAARNNKENFYKGLISDITSAARLINISFNKNYPEDLRLKQEMNFPVRKGMSAEEIKEALDKHEYYEFPYNNGGFIDLDKAPINTNNEEEYFHSWAKEIYEDLNIINSYIDANFKKEEDNKIYKNL